MKCLANFLEKFKCTNKEHPNWGSLRSGLWKIPRDERFTFFNIISKALHSWDGTYNKCMGLVFRPPPIFKSPFLLDLDFQTKTEIVLDPKMCATFARLVAKKLQADLGAPVTYLVVMKAKGYWAKIKGEDVFKSGCHVYYPRSRCTLADSTRIRSYCVERIHEVFGSINYVNPEDDVCDKRIPHRTNGLMMIGDYKPDRAGAFKGGRYCVKVAGSLNGETFIEDQISEERFLAEIGRYYDDIYGFVFEGPDHGWAPPKKIPPKKKKKVASTAGFVKKEKVLEITFDLKEFLRVTKGWVPDDESYKQICMFMETQGLDPQKCNQLCNKAWGYDDQETKRLMDNYNGSLVTRRSMIRLLTLHSCCEWEERNIFPGRCYKYFNEARMFNKKQVWNINEVERFFTDVICTTWGSGDTEFLYQEKLTKRYGNTYYSAINTVIRGDIPFSTAKSDKLIMLEPPLKNIEKTLLKMSKMKAPHVKQTDKPTIVGEKHALRAKIENAKKLVKQLKKVNNDTVRYKMIKDFLAEDMPDPVEKTLSEILTKCKQRAGSNFREFHSYVVIPYLWSDSTPSDQINIFPGFDMMRFANKGDITKTRFWTLLWVAWANRDEYKMDWILCYLAFKLQNPSRKVHKFLIAFCNECGVGKTSIRLILSSIFDVDKVLFCETVEELQKDENCEFLNKMFCLVDDIEKCSRKVSDSLKSKISSDTFKYKKLYADRKTLPSYLDLIATSNAREPTFVGNDNRRTELVVINPELKGDRAFWKGFYEEDCKKPEIAGMWFHYLAHKELTLDVTDPECRFDLQALQKHKIKSMKLVHRFVIEFMQDPECFESSFIKFRDVEELWFNKIKFTTEDGVNTCLVAYKRLYRYFQHWRKTTGQQLSVKESTFFDDLRDINLVKVRRTIDSHKITVILFRPPYIRQSIKALYKLDRCCLGWCWTSEEQFPIYQKRNWQFSNLSRDTGTF